MLAEDEAGLFLAAGASPKPPPGLCTSSDPTLVFFLVLFSEYHLFSSRPFTSLPVYLSLTHSKAAFLSNPAGSFPLVPGFSTTVEM